MGWLVRTLGAAVVGGLGWKLGNDLYDSLKKRMGADQGNDKNLGNPVKAEVVRDAPGARPD